MDKTCVTFTLQRLNISNQYGNIMEIYYSLDKHHSGRNNGTGCLTCLGEFPHPGEVVHVAVAHHGVGGQEKLRGDLERGVGGQGGQVDGHQLVPRQPAKSKDLLQTRERSLLSSSRPNKTFSSSFRFTLHPCIWVASMIIMIMQQSSHTEFGGGKFIFFWCLASQSPYSLKVKELSEGIRSNVLDFIPL